MDNSGRPLETEMIDDEPYSVDELWHKFIWDTDWDIWYEYLSIHDQSRVDQVLAGKDWREVE